MTERVPAVRPKAAPDKPTERLINRRMAQIESMIRIAFKERRPPERKNMEAALHEIASLLQSDVPDKINSAVYKMDFLEQEFTFLCIYPAVKSRLIVLWSTMALLCIVTHGLIGEHALLYYMDQEHMLSSFSQPIAGHALSFMPLRYLLY